MFKPSDSIIREVIKSKHFCSIQAKYKSELCLEGAGSKVPPENSKTKDWLPVARGSQVCMIKIKKIKNPKKTKDAWQCVSTSKRHVSASGWCPVDGARG